MIDEKLLIKQLKKEKYFYSVDKIYEEVKNDSNTARNAVEKIIQNQVAGSGESFLQLIDLLINQKNYFLAHILSHYATNRHKGNSDLYAALIETSIQMENTKELVSGIYIDIEEHLKECANWTKRLYRAFCRYCSHMVVNCSREEKTVYLEEGIKYARALQQLDLYDEEGYLWEAEFYLSVNDREKALLRLWSSIFEPPDPQRDIKLKLKCPKCCKLFLEEFSRGINDQMIGEIASKGLNFARELPRHERKEYEDFFEDKRQQLQEKNKIPPLNFSNIERERPQRLDEIYENQIMKIKEKELSHE